MHSPDLVDVNEGARLTGLRPQTLYRLARHGQLRAFRILRRTVRFDRAELLKLVSPLASRSAKA